MPIEQKKVTFHSRGEMKKMVNGGVVTDDHAIISINDTSTEYDEMIHLLEGTNHLCVMFADSDGNDGISDLQAKAIHHFIQSNQDKTFVVHCFMGISRSGAVAKYINEYLGLDDWYLNDYAGYNRRVFNKLMAVTGQSLAAFYEELEKEERRGNNGL